MRKKIYGLIAFIFISSTLFMVFDGYRSYNHLKHKVVQDKYNKRLSEYRVIIEKEKAFLNSIAYFFTSNETIIKAYKNDDRESIIKFVSPLWKNLKKQGVIREIHFFKRPVHSYVNFSNLQNFNIDVSKVREDLVWVESSFQPSTHFLICKTFTGFRITYPIISEDKILGGLSIGIDINEIAKTLGDIDANDQFVILNDKALQKSLLSDAYESTREKAVEKDGCLYVTNKEYDLALESGYELKGDKLFSKFEVVDFEGKEIGYIVIVDSLQKQFYDYKEHALKHLLIMLITLAVILSVIVYLFKYMIDNIIQIEKIVELIKAKKFEKLPLKVESRSMLEILRNNVIEMGLEMKAYTSILSKKLKDYTDKAYLDPLTNIFNRRALDEIGVNLFRAATLSHEQLSVVIFDIDDFKKLNDTYGHNVGDMVLVEVSQLVKNMLREDDLYIRYGGEEFVIVFPSTNIAACYNIAKKIVEKVDESTLDIEGEKIDFTISAGTSSYQDGDESLYSIIERADEKLYIAKKSGKNRVEV